jgi:protein arginine kinase activator
MQCQSCNEKPATVHLTEIVEGEKHEVHLCEDCARNEGVNPLSAQNLFTHLMDVAKGPATSEEQIVCDTCGLSYQEFRQRGRLGCAECYKLFKDPLTQLLEKIHGGKQHLGKVPSRAGDSLKRERELIELRRELSQTIQREDYERAAEIRDRLKHLEESDEGG